MQASSAGPLATYNSLTDEHLSEHLSRPRTIRHLRRMGLITRDGRIVDEGTVRVNNARKEHKARSKGVLANSIVNKAIEIERKRRSDLKRKLALLEKIEIVEKVKSQKLHPAGIQEFNPYRSIPPPPRLSMTLDMHFDKLNLSSEQISDMKHLVGKITRGRSIPYPRAKSPYEEDLSSRYSTPLPQPPSTPRPSTAASVSGRRSVVRSRPSTAPAGMGSRTRRGAQRQFAIRSQPKHSNATITLKFIGTGLHLDSYAMDSHLSDVVVVQQHCGGNTLPLYKGKVKPKDVFTFVSKRHIGMPYGLTIYLDGMMDSRVSACCEYRHQCGRLLGSKTAHFKLVKVEGGKPCYRCQVEQNKKYLREKQDKEVETILGAGDITSLSLQELTTPQEGANGEEEQPVIDSSPFHSCSEVSGGEADQLESKQSGSLSHHSGSKTEVVSDIEERGSLASHSSASVESRGSRSSKASAASSKSSIHSHSSTISKASSHSSKSSKAAASSHCSPTSSTHSLRENDTDHLSSKDGTGDHIPKDKADAADDEYNYDDDNFEEPEDIAAENNLDRQTGEHSKDGQHSTPSEEEQLCNEDTVAGGVAAESNGSKTLGNVEEFRSEELQQQELEEPVEATDGVENERLSESESTEGDALTTREITGKASSESIDREIEQHEPSHVSEKHSKDIHPGVVDASSPSVEGGGESEETLPAAEDSDVKRQQSNSESEQAVDSTSVGSQTIVTEDDRNDIKHSQEDVQENEPEDDAITEPEIITDDSIHDPYQSNEKSESIESPKEEPAEDVPNPENNSSEGISRPSNDNEKEAEVESTDTAETKTSQQGILLTTTKRKPTRLSVSFESQLPTDDQPANKHLSASLTLEEAQKMLQKSQSNVSLGSLLNEKGSDRASSVDLSESDDDEDIPDLERKISVLLDNGIHEGETIPQSEGDSTAEGVENEQNNVENEKDIAEQEDNAVESIESENKAEQLDQEIGSDLDKDIPNDSQEKEAGPEEKKEIGVDQDGGVVAGGQDNQQGHVDSADEPTPAAQSEDMNAGGSVTSGLSSSSSKSSLTSVSSRGSKS